MGSFILASTLLRKFNFFVFTCQFFFSESNISPHVREPRTVLDSGFHVVDSRNWIPDSLSVKFGLWIPIVSGIPDSLSCIRIPKPRIPNSTRAISRILGFGSTSKDFRDSDIRFEFFFLEFTCRRKHVIFFNKDSLLLIDAVIWPNDQCLLSFLGLFTLREEDTSNRKVLELRQISVAPIVFFIQLHVMGCTCP